jgi:BCD family chlorophyll transporter-like MFS transporter
VAVVTSLFRDRAAGSLRAWMIGGCIASAIALAAIASSAVLGPDFPFRTAVFALGTGNGAFAVSAIGAMMGLAGHGQGRREGTRMGLWGASQALAFGLGGFAGTVAVDVSRHLFEQPGSAYAAVFLGEATLFLVGAAMAARLGARPRSRGAAARPGILLPQAAATRTGA